MAVIFLFFCFILTLLYSRDTVLLSLNVLPAHRHMSQLKSLNFGVTSFLANSSPPMVTMAVNTNVWHNGRLFPAQCSGMLMLRSPVICSIIWSMSANMLNCLRLQHFVYLYLGGLLLLLAGLQQVEAAAATEMANFNWKPFIYGGMASIVAEFGTWCTTTYRLTVI